MVGEVGDTSRLARRALDHPQRARLLDDLRGAPEGLGVAELSTRTGLHANTVRWHLRALADAGLVQSEAVHRGVAGRPGLVYRVAGAAIGADGYRFLAELLASALAAEPEGVERARATGRAWGGHLVDEPPPFTRVEEREALETVVGLLAGHGFAPRRTRRTIEMHRCPFGEIVSDYGRVVCALHAGLLEGALDRLGAPVGVGRLVPFARPGVCTVDVVHATAG
jgi:predicted ArsR family transcriptional regulator